MSQAPLQEAPPSSAELHVEKKNHTAKGRLQHGECQLPNPGQLQGRDSEVQLPLEASCVSPRTIAQSLTGHSPGRAVLTAHCCHSDSMLFQPDFEALHRWGHITEHFPSLMENEQATADTSACCLLPKVVTALCYQACSYCPPKQPILMGSVIYKAVILHMAISHILTFNSQAQGFCVIIQ